MSYDMAEDWRIPEYHQTRVWLGGARWCVMRELDPGACAFSVDSVDRSTPVADMPSLYAIRVWQK